MTLVAGAGQSGDGVGVGVDVTAAVDDAVGVGGMNVVEGDGAAPTDRVAVGVTDGVCDAVSELDNEVDGDGGTYDHVTPDATVTPL
jgi:hypothetical protein